jgi:hypothetical protein
MYQVIPPPAAFNERKTVTVEVDGVKHALQIRLRFMETLGLWHMSLYDPKTGVCMAESIPLLCGLYPASDLLGPFGALGIGSAYIVPLVKTPTTPNPSKTNFGTEYALVWGDRIV